MAASEKLVLDEIQWSDTNYVRELQGIHSNTVLFYFARSPFFDQTSNNAVVFHQALHNSSMFPIIHLRETFEARLRSMSGLEFIVSQEPAETGPGHGTGVWVIRKQTRRKRSEPGLEDELTIHANYFVIGENIYQSPTLADIITSKIAITATSVTDALATASGIQSWSPDWGHGIRLQDPHAAAEAASSRLTARRTSPPAQADPPPNANIADPDSRLAEESFAIHLQYGDQYMDENPITGQPGEFHLSSTGRMDKPASQGPAKAAAVPSTKTPPDSNPLTKDAKSDKTKNTPAKPKRRKSKAGNTTPS